MDRENEHVKAGGRLNTNLTTTGSGDCSASSCQSEEGTARIHREGAERLAEGGKLLGSGEGQRVSGHLIPRGRPIDQMRRLVPSDNVTRTAKEKGGNGLEVLLEENMI